MFDILGDREAATFNSWMATAAYDGREQGHCGNFWNMLWALPGVSRSGPLASDLESREDPQKPSEQRQLLTKAIAAIEASNEEPKLVTLAEFTARSSKANPSPAPSAP
jgi:hypothetical protein